MTDWAEYFFNRNKKEPDLSGDHEPSSWTLLFFLTAILGLSFVLYTILFASPSGTDVYTHMYNTQRMADSASLDEFYTKSMMEEYRGYDYPFGLWYFGSLVIKFTGLDIYTISYIIPLILLAGMLVIFYCYSFELLASRNAAILSLIFLVGMPKMALSLLNLSTGIFIMPFLVALIFLSFRPIEWKNEILILLFAFILCFTHTGTYLFLISFAIIYFLLRAAIWKKIDLKFFILVVSLIFCYIAAVSIFPYIQPQYIDKGTLVVSTTEAIASATHIDLIRVAGQTFYDTIFVANNFIFAFLWSALVFFTGKSIIFLRGKVEQLLPRGGNAAAIPFIGNITNISHDIIATPIWIGPLQTIFSIIGIFKLEGRGICIGLSLIFTSLIPGAIGGSEGTGALREISFLLLLIPVASAAGFSYLYPRIINFGKTPAKKILVILTFLVILVSLIAVPIIACLHYQPALTMTKEEKINLEWLGTVGSPQDGAAGNLYKERMSMYANKTVPSIPAGTETKRYSKDLINTYFSKNPEEYTVDLNSYQVKYLISSARTLKEYTYPWESLTIDSNTQVDKIYAAGDFFGIYQIISGPPSPKTTIPEQVSWSADNNSSRIQDIGSAFLFENDYYKIKISDTAPNIRYLGTKTRSYLGDGYFMDRIAVAWGERDNRSQISKSFDIEELSFSDISHSDNAVLYKTRLKDDTNQSLVSLAIQYTFNERAFTRKITLTNDLPGQNRTADVNVMAYSSIFSPMDSFEYLDLSEGNPKWVSKKIYPAADSVEFDDILFNSLYFKSGEEGIYLTYDNLVPYPTKLTYKGSIYYDYGVVSVQTPFYTLKPSEPDEIIQHFSVGNKQTAKKSIEQYTSVSLYQYPNAEIPLVIGGLIEYSNMSVNEKNGLSLIRNIGVPYTLGISIPNTSESITPISAGIPVISSLRVTEREGFKSYDAQNREVKKFKEIYDGRGAIIPLFRFDLNTIRVLSENTMQFAEALSARAPDEEWNHEGLRNLKFAYVDGNNTGIVLLPVTLPSSTILNPESDPDDVFSEWNKTVISVVQDGGSAIFRWDLADIGNPEYSEQFKGLINYSYEMNLTPTTPDSLTTHYQNLRNIESIVTTGNDFVIIKVYNNQNQPVNGITYKVVLPLIDKTCPYDISNGRITRYSVSNTSCTAYAGIDLKSYEEKTVTLKMNTARQQFVLNFTRLYQGQNTIRVMNENWIPVSNASVSIGTSIYETDENGAAVVSMRRGKNTIIVDKPGFIPFSIETDVSPAIYRYFSFLDRE